MTFDYQKEQEQKAIHCRTLFCKDPFFDGFCSSEQQKGTLTDFRRINNKNFELRLFIWVIFLQKREIFGYFIYTGGVYKRTLVGVYKRTQVGVYKLLNSAVWFPNGVSISS